MERNAAETIGLKAVAWLAADEDLLPVFMGSSGADEATMRAAVHDPQLLAAVLDFIVMDDAWILSFCQSIGVEPEAVMSAKAALPGGEEIHWT